MLTLRKSLQNYDCFIKNQLSRWVIRNNFYVVVIYDIRYKLSFLTIHKGFKKLMGHLFVKIKKALYF